MINGKDFVCACPNEWTGSSCQIAVGSAATPAVAAGGMPRNTIIAIAVGGGLGLLFITGLFIGLTVMRRRKVAFWRAVDSRVAEMKDLERGRSGSSLQRLNSTQDHFAVTTEM